MDGAVEHTGTVLAAGLRVNAMVSLYAGISATSFFRQVQHKFSNALLSKNEFELITGEGLQEVNVRFVIF
jgi:hypothetical protein